MVKQSNERIANAAETWTFIVEMADEQPQGMGHDFWQAAGWRWTITDLPSDKDRCGEGGVFLTIPEAIVNEWDQTCDMESKFALLAPPSIIKAIGQKMVEIADRHLEKDRSAWEKLNDELGPTVAAIEKELTTKEESNGKQQAKDTVPN